MGQFAITFRTAHSALCKGCCSKEKSRSKLKKTYINMGLQSGLGADKKWVGKKILFDIVEPA